MNNQTKTPKKERMHDIDLLKGIAIVLTVLGHYSFHDYATQIIYFFHMPLFFVISGFLDKLEGISFGDHFKKKLKRLMYPYITFGILILVYNTLLDDWLGNGSPGKLGKRIVALVYGNYIWESNTPYIGALWFLPGLFCSGMIAYIICRIFGKSKGKLLLFGGISMLGGAGMMVVKNRYGVRLPWCLDVALIGALFYLAGYFWRQEWQDKVNRTYQGVLLLAVGFLLETVNLVYMKFRGYEILRPDMLIMNYGIIPLWFAGALFISLGLMVVVKNVYHGKMRWMEKVGELSMLIMIDHIYIQQRINAIILNHFNRNFWIISFPVSLAISIALALIIDKYLGFLADYGKLKILLEKRKNLDGR